jgi:cell wall-associated NlpC family hydrolase
MRIAAAVAVIVAVGTMGTGYATAAATTPGEPHRAGAAASSPAAPALAIEARRELAAMQTSHYQHRTDVDEQTGSFDFDCSGFVDYALGRALPADLAALPVSTSSRPLAADIERHLQKIRDGGGAADPWRPVPTVADLAPGDVIAWLATEDSTTDDTGHVMIVTGSPTRDPSGTGRWLVPVADSTISPHAHDSRHDDASGLGTGTIGLAVDEHGEPVAFAWRGGISTRWHTTEIALGRPT